MGHSPTKKLLVGLGPHGDAFVLPMPPPPAHLRGLLLVSVAGARFGLDRTVEGNPLGTFRSYKYVAPETQRQCKKKGEKGFWKQFWVTGRSPPQKSEKEGQLWGDGNQFYFPSEPWSLNVSYERIKTSLVWLISTNKIETDVWMCRTRRITENKTWVSLKLTRTDTMLNEYTAPGGAVGTTVLSWHFQIGLARTHT